MEAIRKSIGFLRASPAYVIVNRQPGLEGVLVDLRYGTRNNFSGEDRYGPLKDCYLHQVAAAKLAGAAALLRSRLPGYRFLVLDALRPRSVQWVLWEFVKGTAQEKYLANPETGSIHNYGFAVDLTLADESGAEVDMGTAFDAFNEASEPQHEDRLLAEGRLRPEHLTMRRHLRDAMTGAGFLTVPHEWWHFEALSRQEVRAGFPIVE